MGGEKYVTSKNDACLFLKTIQIQGFKSFADKLRIDLQPGLSVFIGPNGSGKSNIADAVRWVLGEQSAKSLRGNKMEDVIFAGSSTRKPVGMAEVSLVFDNSTGIFPLDYEEVVITRRVFRDGEGHFYINKTPCRLRDIQELLLDTGSGKEGFSIIGQGRVDEILNLKAEERRLLIEEVAGISKFRLRKKEALKKLEETDNNLNRLNDIISEVEAQLEPLAKQAEIAKIFQSLTEELKRAEINQIVLSLLDLESKIKNDHQQKLELSKALTTLNTEIAQGESKSLKSKVELNRLEQEIQNLQAETYADESKAKELTHNIALLVERKKHNKDKSTQIEQEKHLAEHKIDEFQAKLGELHRKEEFLQSSVQDAHSSLAKLDSDLHSLKAQANVDHLEKLKTEIFEELTNKSKLLNNLAEIENENVALERQKEQLIKEIETKEEQKNGLEKALREQEDKQSDYKKKEYQLSRDFETVRLELQQQEKLLLTVEEQKKVLQRKNDQATARLNALQNLEDNLEGYHQGVRETIFAARQGKVQCSGLYGTVADNIDVDARYELAVETALGNSLQNIILETTEDGKKCINYLRRTNKGRATFLPLDAIKGSKISLNQSTTTHQGFLGLAVDLIRFDVRFKNIMESLLGRVIVADNLDSAIELARLNNYRYRVVTLLGDQVNIGGSLTGGSTKSQKSGLLSRSREIEQISRFLTDLKTEDEALEQKIAKIKKIIAQKTTEKESLEKGLKDLQEAQRISVYEQKHLAERVRQLEESLRILNYELNDVQIALKETVPKMDELKKSLELSEQKVNYLRSEQVKLDKLVKESNVQIQELSEKITNAKIDLARREQELQQVRQLCLENEEQLLLTKELVNQKAKEIMDLEKAYHDLEKEQGALEKSIEELNQGLDDKKYELTQLRKEKEVRSAEAIRLEECINDLRQQAREKEQQLHQLELRTTRWQTEWDSGLTRLQEEYSLSWEKAKSYRPERSKESLQRQVQTLKAQIAELGPVNHAALEEYPAALERYEFLTAQRNDLVEASDSLLELIQSLDRNMAERFAVGFKAVNKAFQEVFHDLFQGGRAELVLDDPTNLLETGVKIIAQPPGKKAQLLSLLSGGERAFTAIALLFAFLKVKPSPFCLLDEIEAALDEVNVRRFVQYLRKLSTKTQFILISHRRGTMEAADTLYGITMEESGVSKMLTVALTEEAG
ncbi:MAG: chromosome segregation protein SMC [Peptococcaceae bacterium]|nr:chromosome segregation protein SMC [Peptococcaceae bacterium]